jgi:hypothetical protein
LVSSRSLPSFRSAPRDARRRLPASGSRGPHFPPFPGTLRREDCPPAPRGTLRVSLAVRYLAGSRRSWSPFPARGSVEAPRSHARVGGAAGSPDRQLLQGDRWLSPVPECPLGVHAPLLDPGGVPASCLFESGTVAFRPLEAVGVPLLTSLRVILLSTTIPISRLHHAACMLVPSRSVLPLRGVHVEVATDSLARRSSGGT